MGTGVRSSCSRLGSGRLVESDQRLSWLEIDRVIVGGESGPGARPMPAGAVASCTRPNCCVASLCGWPLFRELRRRKNHDFARHCAGPDQLPPLPFTILESRTRSRRREKWVYSSLSEAVHLSPSAANGARPQDPSRGCKQACQLHALKVVDVRRDCSQHTFPLTSRNWQSPLRLL